MATQCFCSNDARSPGKGQDRFSGFVPDSRVTAAECFQHMLSVENGFGRKVVEGLAFEGWKAVRRQWFHDGIEAWFEEKGDGISCGGAEGTPDPVRRGHEIMAGPDFEHVTQVDHEATWLWARRDPGSVSPSDFESAHTVLGKEGEAAKVRMFPDALTGA